MYLHASAPWQEVGFLALALGYLQVVEQHLQCFQLCQLHSQSKEASGVTYLVMPAAFLSTGGPPILSCVVWVRRCLVG